MNGENVTQLLANYLAKTEFKDLPSEAVDSTKAHILHTLGTIAAGSRAPGVSDVLACVADWGTKEESTVLVFGHKLPAPAAALMNATMAHCFHVDMKMIGVPTSRALQPFRPLSRLPKNCAEFQEKNLSQPSVLVWNWEFGLAWVSKLQIRPPRMCPRSHRELPRR